VEACKNPHGYLFLDPTINDLVRFGTKISLGETCEIFATVQCNERVKVTTTFLHVLKYAKPQARRSLLASAEDEPIKAIIECAISTLNGTIN
jgi:hypothetical protein